MRTIVIVGPGKGGFIGKIPSAFHGIYQGMVQQAENMGFQTKYIGSDELTDAFFQKILRGGYCGLLIYAPSLQSDPRLNHLKKNSVPIVVEGCSPGKIGFDSVMPNHQAGCYDLTRFLIEKGCRRILRCWGIPEPLIQLNPAGVHWIAHRNLGHEQAIRETQFELLPAVNITFPLSNQPPIPHHIFEKRVELTVEYLRPYLTSFPPIDGILASNDINGFEISAACRKLGVKPNQDIPITGYDNDWDRLYKREWEDFIPYATIDKQDEKIGANMVEILTKRLEKKLGPGLMDLQIPPKLVIPNQIHSHKT